MSTSQYLLGVGELAAIAAALGLGAFYLRALIVPAWTGALGRLAEFVLGVSALVVISELLGLLGLFEEIPLVLGCAIVGLGTAWWARPQVVDPEHGEFPAVKPSRAMLAVAAVASIVVVAHWAEPTQEAMDIGMYYQDTTWYHMSFSGRFAQTGEVGPLHLTDPLKLTAWYYPQNSELLHAVPMVAMDSDFLSPLINLGWLAVSLLAAWCIGRPYAVGAVTLMGGAVVLDSEMLVASQAGNAPNDIAGLFFLLCVMAFLVNGAATSRAAPRFAGVADRGHGGRGDLAPGAGPGFDPEADEEHPQEGVVTEVPVAGDPRALAGVGAAPLVLAGLAAGLGIGTKITLLAALGFLTLGLAYLGGREGWWRAVAYWLGGILITGGFWYLRNIWFALNPFPQIEKLGPIDLPGPEQGGFYPRQPHSLSEYYNDPSVWKSFFFPPLNEGLGPLWPLILGLVAGGLLFALWRGGSRLMRVLAATGLFAGIAYVFTPLTASGALGQPTGFEANLRYVAPALIVAFTVVPLVPALRRRRWPWALIGLFGLLILQGDVRVGIDGGLDLDVAPSWNYGHLDESLILALLVVGVPALIVAGARAGYGMLPLAGFAAAALALIVVLGDTQREQYLDERYEASVAPELGGGFRSTADWKPLQVFGKRTRDSRIGVVGRASAFGQYFFYGDDISNHVQYIGEELNRGTFRQIANCRDFRRTANEGDYDYLVVTPRLRREDRVSPELFWIGDDPATKKNKEAGGLAGVYRVDGRLDPSTCKAADERFTAAKAKQEAERRAEVLALLETLPPDEAAELRERLRDRKEELRKEREEAEGE